MEWDCEGPSEIKRKKNERDRTEEVRSKKRHGQFLMETNDMASGNIWSWLFKDGAYYCYCAYVLRISRYSDFLSPMLTNTGIFLCGLKLSGESRS